MAKKENYIPAMGFTSLAALYDPLVGFFMREQAFKSRLIKQADIRKDHTVLDLGCGTATLTLMIKRYCAGAEVFGLDGDTKILQVAKKKVENTGVDVQLDEGMSFEMPYPDSTFDRVLSSLVFHHLTLEDQVRTLAEVLRILKPGGELHITDFAVFHQRTGHLAAHLMSHFRSRSMGSEIQLVKQMAECGFAPVEDRGRFSTLFGRIGYFRGVKPGTDSRG